MRILILTQKFDSDDHILGFLYTWLIKIARQIDELHIVTLEHKYAELKENIKVYSAGKELGYNKIRLFYNLNKIVYSILLKKKIDLVFVLMCPEYALIVSLYAKILGVPVVMWYAHGKVNMRLRIAHFLVNRVVSSSRDSFRLKSIKIIIIGQGIDVNKFKIQNSKFKIDKTNRIILSVGRVSPIKNYETLIKAADILVNQKNIRDVEFQIIGGAYLKSQEAYLGFLKYIIRKYKLEDYIQFVGAVPYRQIQGYYQNCDLFVSTSNTGSLDKVVLEAMACEKIVVTCNEAFSDLLNDHSDILNFDKNNPDSLARNIVSILEMNSEDKGVLAHNLREIVLRNHNLNRFVDNILRVFKDTIDNK